METPADPVSTPLVITVAPTGAELPPDAHPELPTTPAAIVDAGVACEQAGARVIHVHVRDATGRPTQDVGVFRETLDGLRERTQLIVQFTTGGAIGDPPDARLAPLELRPDMASLTCGSVNFGEGVFENPFPLMRRLFARMAELDIQPEFELFDLGHIANARTLLAAEHAADDRRVHCDLVLGVPGGAPGAPDVVSDMVQRLPTGWSWSATGVGRAHLPVLLATLAAGGHVRTGFEDVLYLSAGRRARDNAELIERVARVAAEVGRPLATPEQARALLGARAA